MAVQSDMTVRGIEQASGDRVPEGNTGGGTGMMCQGYKGGTGSASRVINGKRKNDKGEKTDVAYTVAALVQAVSFVRLLSNPLTSRTTAQSVI